MSHLVANQISFGIRAWHTTMAAFPSKTKSAANQSASFTYFALILISLSQL